ncbi:MAG: hypothetical protein RL536_8, partial [Candidatus Parcubacteria bacterium]|jgi:DNA helicase-2/ATP-dependent DNA helicase PcrA
LVAELHLLTKNESESTIAIIVRRNRDLERVIRLLESHNIPVSSERSVDIFNHPIGRLFFNLIEYLENPAQVDSLAKTVIAGMWGLNFEKGVEIIKALRSGQGALIEEKIPKLLHLQRMKLNDSAVGFVIHSAELSGYASLIAQHPSYVHVWRGIVSLAESLTRESNLTDPTELIKNMLAYRTSAESRTVKVAVGAPDVPIQALTAHGSKGLEFDYVFIPYATEEAWIGRPKGASFVLLKKRTDENDIRDVRRLFYVALTRARKHVTVLTALEESDGKDLSPLRFIDELDQKNVEKIGLKRVGVEELYGNAKTNEAGIQDEIGRKLVDMTKHVLLEKGLSVTALNHFLECPNKFLYQSILKLPQAPSVPAEKGTAMHEAISNVWKSKKHNVKDIQRILEETVTNYFEASFLPILEKESVKRDLLKDIPAVAKALQPHFSVPKNSIVLTETRVEAEFLAQSVQVYSGSKKEQLVQSRQNESTQISIPIHGKLDSIVNNGGEVLVFDYKTKRAMSAAAIRGETKTDADGNYFRQLIFYKMLVNEDARWRNKRITPALVFISPDDKGRCPTVTIPIEKGDIDRVKSEVQSLVDAVWNGEIARAKCDDMKCEWCGLR